MKRRAECWIDLRQVAPAAGALKPGCCETGPNARQVLEGDHINPADKGALTGGPPRGAAMRAEAAKCQWLCRFCHQLEPTGTVAGGRKDPATMEENDEDRLVKHSAKIRYPKQCGTCEKRRRGSFHVPAPGHARQRPISTIATAGLLRRQWRRRRPRK